MTCEVARPGFGQTTDEMKQRVLAGLFAGPFRARVVVRPPQELAAEGASVLHETTFADLLIDVIQHRTVSQIALYLYRASARKSKFVIGSSRRNRSNINIA